MTTEVRGARPQDSPEIISLLNDAFGNSDDESGIFEVLVNHDPAYSPDCTRLVVVDGVPTAMTVILPRRVRVRTGWVDGAELTLVGCRTAQQGRGYGSLAVRDALAYMRSRGLAAAIFYGEHEYYPRFGCAPVLPTYRAVLPVGPAAESASATSASAGSVRTTGAGLIEPARLVETSGGVRLEPARDADIPAMNRLYADAMCVYVGAVARTDEPWEWHPRSDEYWSVRVLPDRSAFAVTRVVADRCELFVREAGAVDGQATLRLLAALIAETVAGGLRQVAANLPPDHALHRAMAACGAESLRRPASPGFAVVTDWTRVLPEGYAVDGDALLRKGRPVLRADTIPLTQLAMGYLDIDDLMLLPNCRVVGDDTALALLRQDFPRLHPRYSWAPFYMLR